ncbi:MAG: VIT1/CCC1 transporter family protein [Nitrososphaerota archaeon]|nr:VIT1/CCC1 transporter family protein [Aigarchaeota archaeon]MDW8077215.1 VIT1/CCC1 transporter family protein [Nitrososphaerota archaeon]
MEKNVKFMVGAYRDEYVDSRLYKVMATYVKEDNKRRAFEELSEVEKTHADFWYDFLDSMGIKPSVGPVSKLKLFFMILFVKLFGYRLTIRLFEAGELSAIKRYARLYRTADFTESARKKLGKIIHDEISHEEYLISEVLKIRPMFERVRDALYGMVDALVEILAVVVGLASIIRDPTIVALAGIISGSAGTFSMAAGAYLSAKSQHEIVSAKSTKVEMEAEVSPESAYKKLADYFRKEGLREEDVELVVSRLMESKRPYLEILKHEELGSTESELPHPRRAALDAGLYYFLAALFPILPFVLGLSGIFGVVAAIVSSAIVLTITGILVGVLTGISPLRKAGEMVGVALGAAGLTYMIGTLAKTLLGIEVF